MVKCIIEICTPSKCFLFFFLIHKFFFFEEKRDEYEGGDVMSNYNLFLLFALNHLNQKSHHPLNIGILLLLHI